jgi:hypothetical protein
VRAPAQGGHLGAGVDAIDAGAGGGVPEVDVAIVGSAAGGEEVGLPWAPADGLDGSLVVGLGELGDGEGAGVPDGDEVVIAAGSELGTVGAPLEATDLGGMGDELGGFVLGDADIVVEDEAAAGTGGESVLVPPHDTDTGIMSVHAAELGALLNVPDLDLTRAESNADVGSVAGPLNAADIGVWASLEERADGSGLGGPDVDIALEANGDLVVGAPVEKVEVVVIDESRGIKNTFWSSGDTASELGSGRAGGLERTVVLGAKVDWLGRLRRGRLESKDAGVLRDSASRCQRVLVGNGVWRWARVCSRWLLIGKVQAVESSGNIVISTTSSDVESASTGSKDRRSIAVAGLWALLVRSIELSRASCDNTRASSSVRDEPVTAV